MLVLDELLSIKWQFDDLAHSISLGVAPVFLHAGIAGFLKVMSGRLGRESDIESD